MKVLSIVRYHIGDKLIIKFILIYIVIFAIPLLLVYSSMYQRSRESIVVDAGNQSVTALKNISNTIDEVLKNADSVHSHMQSNYMDSSIIFMEQGLSQEKNFWAKEELSSVVHKLYVHNQYIHSIELYNPYWDMLLYSKVGSTRVSIKDISTKDTVHTINNISNDELWTVEEVGGQLFLSSYSSPFYSQDANKKLLFRVLVSADIVTQRLAAYYPNGNVISFITNNKNSYAISSNELGNNIISKLAKDNSTAAGSVSFMHNGELWIHSWFQSNYTQWTYSIVSPIDTYSSSTSVLNEYLLYFIITLLVIFAISATFVVIYIIKPMYAISNLMKDAEKGDLSVRLYSNRRDELGYIGHRFNELLDSVDNLIYENYQIKLHKQGYELKFIQTQLKEHFIYNTLDTIHWLANQHQVPQISRIIFDLAKFFRSILNNGSDISTLENLGSVFESYISLINIRLDSAIKLNINIPPHIAGYKVVKYFFQPLLENAIIHGIVPKKSGSISISFKKITAERIQFTIKDDGIGIAPIRLKLIQEAIESDLVNEDNFFALVNVNKQLKLYYGSNYSFNISSIYGEGTCVAIEIPYTT